MTGDKDLAPGVPAESFGVSEENLRCSALVLLNAADFCGLRFPDVGRLLADIDFEVGSSVGGGDKLRKYRPVGRGIRLVGPVFLEMEICFGNE